MLTRTGNPPVRIVLWNGEVVSASNNSPVASIHLQDRVTLFKLASDPEYHFGDAYTDGRVKIEGDLFALLEAIYRAIQSRSSTGIYPNLVSRWLEKRQANSLRGSRRNIHHHYDLRTDFYKLWLDPNLLYTCAYYPSADDTLEEAQVAKMHYVCRKVQLQPGEQVVEAGCGWGALALHMARHYGVSVKAFNISHEQIAYARERAKEEGLSDRVEFIEDDYRNIKGKYDVFMSVGMLEHVGIDNYRELGKVIDRSLHSNGRGFLHSIGRNTPAPLNSWIRKRIFPGAEPPTLRHMMEIFEPRNFSVVDVENLRLHYARTLEHWLARFENSAREVARMFDERFVRAWRLYLAGSATAFRVGTLQLFQIVFARPALNRLAWTRSYLYQPGKKSGQEEEWIHAMS
jgi:cyclopropane-fatty-acyl-phospholipid synthase